MGHIAHLRNSFNQKAHFPKAMIKLIKRDNNLISFLRIEWSLFVKTWISCTKIGGNWLGDSRDHSIFSMYFCYFLISSPWKKACSFFEQTLISIIPGCLVPSLVEIGPVVLLISSMYFRYFIIIPPLKKRQGPSIEQTWILFTLLSAKFGWNWPSNSGK